jgi:hypothetical protein
MDPSINEPQRSRQPLVAIGLVVVVMLLIPMFLYPVAPADPVKEGNVVFSRGKQMVSLYEPAFYRQHGYTDRCVLEPDDQLIILQTSIDGPVRMILARTHGRPLKTEFPFCPQDAKVLLKPEQLAQKASLLVLLKESLASLFAP